MPPDVDLFIMISSVVAITGNPGQSAYGGACAYQDALVRFRRRQGLAAHSINLGVVLDSGFVSEEPEIAAALRRQGLGTISTAELLANLDHIVTNPSANDAVGNHTALGLVPHRGSGERGLQHPLWMKDAKFRHLYRSQHAAVGSSEANNKSASEASFIIDAGGDVVTQVCQAFTRQLGKLLAIPAKHLSEDRSLNDFGADSLVAVELRNWIRVFLQANISLLTLRNTTIRELAKQVVKESWLVTSGKV